MTTWLTPAEAADHAKVSLWTIREAVKAGELPASTFGKSGRHYRIAPEDVDTWLRSNAHEPWGRYGCTPDLTDKAEPERSAPLPCPATRLQGG